MHGAANSPHRFPLGGTMPSLALALGITFLFVVLFDAFQTIILPRRATGRYRLTRLFYIATWRPWSFFVRRICTLRTRETAFSFYGPLSLIFLLALWAGVLVVGFALIFYALGSPFNDAMKNGAMKSNAMLSDLYVSGTTLFTLGLGDVIPRDGWARMLVIFESGTGLGLLAVVMGYFPVLYGAFSRREVSISLLDARAGSPPTAVEMLRRHAYSGGDDALTLLLVEWERWSAELLESHISYPLLCYFRSQHTNQSWLSALTAVLDTSALLIAGVQGHKSRQAQLTFAMARHALVDLAQIFSLPPLTNAADRLPDSGTESGLRSSPHSSPHSSYDQLYALLCQGGVSVCRDGNSAERLRQMRNLYEGYAQALSQHLAMPLPPWVQETPHKDNWLAVAKLRAQADAANSDIPQPTAVQTIATLVDDHHDF
jgi:hypothetical protein